MPYTLARMLRQTTGRGARGKPVGTLPAGVVLDLRINASTSYQDRTTSTTPAGVGDPVRRVVAETGQIATVATDADYGTLQSNGVSLQAYDSSTRQNPELTLDTPLSAAGPCTVFFVGTLTTAELWCTDLLFQGKRDNAHSAPLPTYPNDLTFVKVGTVTTGGTQPEAPYWYIPAGTVFMCLRRDADDNIYISGTNAVYDPTSTRKERYLGVKSGTVELSKIGKAYRYLADEAYSCVNSTTSNRYRQVLAWDSDLTAQQQLDVEAWLAATYGVSTDRREPIAPTMPSYTLPGTVPTEFSRPVFNPATQLVWRGGVRLPSIDIGGTFAWPYQDGGFCVERDGGTLKFTLIHGTDKLVRLTTSGTSFSTNTDPTTWDTLSSSYDDLGTPSLGSGINHVSGVLKHTNGDYFTTGFIEYAGTGPQLSFVGRRTSGGTNYGPFRVTNCDSQASAGVCQAPAWFADYCDATTSSTKTLLIGPAGYHSGSGSGGGQVWALCDSTDTGAADETLASILLCNHSRFNSVSAANRERRDPDYIPTTEWDTATSFAAGENAYWGSVQCRGGVEFIDSDDGHGVVFVATIGIGLQDYNFQSDGFTAGTRDVVYVTDPGQLAAVAKGELTTTQPRGKWYQVPFPAAYSDKTGPWIAGIRFEAGAGTAGADRVYILWGGIIDGVSPAWLRHSVICAYDIQAV